MQQISLVYMNIKVFKLRSIRKTILNKTRSLIGPLLLCKISSSLFSSMNVNISQYEKYYSSPHARVSHTSQMQILSTLRNGNLMLLLPVYIFYSTCYRLTLHFCYHFSVQKVLESVTYSVRNGTISKCRKYYSKLQGLYQRSQRT